MSLAHCKPPTPLPTNETCHIWKCVCIARVIEKEKEEEEAKINVANKNVRTKKSNSYVSVFGFTLPVVVAFCFRLVKRTFFEKVANSLKYLNIDQLLMFFL